MLIPIFSTAQHSTEVSDYHYTHRFHDNMIIFCINNKENCVYYDFKKDVLSIDDKSHTKEVVKELMKLSTIIHKQFICMDDYGKMVHCNCDESRKYKFVLAMSKYYRDIDHEPYVWIESEKIFTNPSIFSSKHGGYILSQP